MSCHRLGGCYIDGDHVTCADLRAGGTARLPCDCSCHDSQKPRALQRGCEADIKNEEGDWLDYCGRTPVKIIAERSYCTGHSAAREYADTLYQQEQRRIKVALLTKLKEEICRLEQELNE